MKKSLLMFLAGAFALSSAGLVSCNDSEEVDKQNTLGVKPLSDITFRADGNEDVVLTIETDAEAWSVEKTDWITTRQEGNTLTVNAEANTSETARPGRITISAGNARPVRVNVLQEGVQVGETVLSITPSDPLAFEATGNRAVELTVTTNAPDWSFTYPEEWMTAEKSGDKLTVNALDNEGEARVGQIVVTTSEGEKSVRIVVTQKAAGEEPEPEVTIAGSLSTAGETTFEFPAEEAQAVVRMLTFTLEKAAQTDVEVLVSFDERRVEEYNFDNGTSHVVYPSQSVAVAKDGVLTVKQGETSASIEVTVQPDASLQTETTYMASFRAESRTEGVSVDEKARYVDLFVTKAEPSTPDPEPGTDPSQKKMRNICYFEVNDCNPLNALEYVLEDGTPFFDAVVLFAGNIKWDAWGNKVYMRANPNVQALLDESDVYLQPLRQKGIKVLLGILGDWDRAGIGGLTDWGCEQFGQELADICRDYQLDGIAFDDEYSQYVSGQATEWFAPIANRLHASRLCYETKMALTETCSWETWVHAYYQGYIVADMPSVTIDGVEHLPGEFIDNVCPDYGDSCSPMPGMDLSDCAAKSIQLRKSDYLTQDEAKGYMDQGYGWIMWFSFDPSGTGSVSGNRSSALQQFRNMALGCYGQTVLDPKNVYNKISEGQYDPTPHPIN